MNNNIEQRNFFIDGKKIKIRRASLSDREEWTRMRSRLWPDCPLEKHCFEIEESIENSFTGNFIAENSDGNLCGFIETSIRNYAEGCLTKGAGYIEGIYVEPEYRMKGMAKELIKTAEEWAISKGCKEMASDCLIDNEISIKAHISSGYKEVERLVHFVKSLEKQEHSI